MSEHVTQAAATAPAAVELEELVALANDLQARCLALGRTVALAESCTGGLVGHALTEVPGSSDYLLGGVVSYADDAKVKLLDVPASTLEHHGAVSAQAAAAMAEGARQRFGADLGLAVTGIAGPSGGTPAKPVGLTYAAIADAEGHDVRRHQWAGDRSANKLASAAALLELALERLKAGEGTTKGPDAGGG
ncbi:MAG TPA: CinA family protein [Candidatus Limnocylindrales bacterium]|nr:CinA family protein [Candidatus Limnocylindrales bacterium]